MLGRTVTVLLVFLGGPALAFATLFLGCGDSQLLGVACGHNMPISFVGFVFAAWVFLGAAAAMLSARFTPP